MEKNISRKEAVAQGLPRYFTVKPCKYGHVDERPLQTRSALNALVGTTMNITGAIRSHTLTVRGSAANTNARLRHRAAMLKWRIRLVGEAKRKLEAVRAEFLAELNKWAFPATNWEARTVAEIKLLPVVKVFRGSDEELAWMRMKPRQCHANARFMEEKDPEQRSKQITGWWLQDGNYVLHSIVDQWGQLVCVTPAPLHRENPFDFIPDPKIEWREEGDYRESYRDGVKIGPGVRTNPADTIAELEIIRQRLLSGMNPYKAVQRD